MRYVSIIFVMLLLFPNFVLAGDNTIKEVIKEEERTNVIQHTEEKSHIQYRILNDHISPNSIHQDLKIDMSNVNNRGILLKIEENQSHIIEQFQVEKLPNDPILKERNIYHVRVPEKVDYRDTLLNIQLHPDVISAEPDYMVENTKVPADPLYQKQWYLPQIDIPKAWEITTGSANITIAVLDSGVNANHPDLKGRVLPGYDFVNRGHDPMDDNGHGTFVSAIIAAKANHLGMVGIDKKSNILPVKITNQAGNASTRNVVNGIYYAIEQGADIINMSYGNYQYSDIEEEALREAYKEGIVLVAAAGNDGTNNWFYPASYPQVISVASTDKNDSPSTFSNYGNFVDIAAPGENIIGANFRGGHVSGDGTSYAAPMVSAIASLLKSIQPSWGPREIEWAISLSSENNTSDEWNPYIGYGRINAYKALNIDLPSLKDDASDTWEQAMPVGNGEIHTDKMDLPMDVDWFSFEVTHPGEVKVDIYNSSEHLDPVAVLYKVEGNRLVESSIIDQGQLGEHEQFVSRLNKGKYRLVVYDYYNHWSKDTYSIRIKTPEVPIDENNQPAFLDINGHWAEGPIIQLAKKGLFSGYTDGTFRPDASITRAEAATIIALDKKLPVERSHFPDVSSNHWATEYIGAIVNEGIMSGYPNGRFKPNEELTREEMAVILVNSYRLTGNTTVTFRDVRPNAWSAPFINKLVANEITVGYPDGRFLPKNRITRGEFASMMARVLKNL